MDRPAVIDPLRTEPPAVAASDVVDLRRLALDAITDFAYVFDLGGRFAFINKPLLDLWGLTLDEAVGKNFFDLQYPDDLAARLQQQIQEVIETRQRVVDETPYTSPTGAGGYYQYIFSPVLAPDGSVCAVAGSTRDITELKRAESRDRFLVTLDDAVRPLTDPDEITLTAARLLGEHLGVDRCAYADVEADEDTMNLTGNYCRDPSVRSIVGRLRFTDFGLEVLQLMRDDQPYVVDDVDTHVPPVGDLAAYRATQIQAVICVPLHKHERFVAAMAVHQRTPRRWTADQVDLIRHVAARCWESIERARVERTLRQSEERRRLALESAELGSWHIDPTTLALTTDERFRAIYGVTADSMNYEEALARVHPDDRQRVHEAVAAACRPDDPVPYTAEHRIVLPDGASRWVFVKGRANFTRRAGAQAVGSLDGTVVDITERKAAQDQARTILESITDAFFAIDPDWRFTYVNRQAQRLLDRTPEQLLGRLIWDAYPGLTGSEFERAYRRAAVDRVAVSLTSYYPDHDRWYEVHVYPSPDGGISIYFRDVSERQRADERDRTAAAEALAAAEANAKFRTFFEQGTYFAGVMTLDGTIVEANRLCLDACGYTREQVLGRKFWDCPWWDHRPDLVEMIRAGTAEAAAGRTFRRETPYYVAGGVERFVDLTLSPVTDNAGRVLFVAPTGTDITDRRLMADQRERALDAERAARAESERVGRLKDEFLATLSHELRTPLNAILGWAQILADNGGGRDAADLADGLRTIERNARAQAQIIEDLLDMSRIISGKVRLDLQSLDLAAVVRGAVETARPTADAKNIRLHAALSATNATVSGDPNRLQQVFWNLLSNAVKFTPAGGHVRVFLEPVGPHLRVTVADTGEGIKPEFLPHVFGRFRQADGTTTRRHGGLGLGLAIVKQLVELHGGAIRAQSSGTGQGATFTVTLPIATSRGTSAQSTESDPGAAPVPIRCNLAASTLQHLRILVVDDEPDARALVQRLLEDCDARVSIAGSAQEAFDLVVAERHDVLVSDIGMPGEDGYSLIKRIRALGPDAGGSVPAIALTAYARAEDRVRSILAGYQFHLTKPAEPTELITVIASLTGRT